MSWFIVPATPPAPPAGPRAGGRPGSTACWPGFISKQSWEVSSSSINNILARADTAPPLVQLCRRSIYHEATASVRYCPRFHSIPVLQNDRNLPWSGGFVVRELSRYLHCNCIMRRGLKPPPQPGRVSRHTLHSNEAVIQTAFTAHLRQQ